MTFREEVGASAVLTDIKVLPQLAGGLEAQHGVVVQAVVPEEDTAPWLQHLERTRVGSHLLRHPEAPRVPGIMSSLRGLTLLTFCKTSFILSG